jgi:ribosomal protein S18 acetylase RimI-like enzyme
MAIDGDVQFVCVSSENNVDFKHLLVRLFPVAYTSTDFKAILNGQATAYLAKRLDKFVGCVAWRQHDHQVEILNMGVLVLHRGSGIGTRLLRFALERAVAEKYLCTVHVANEDDIAFWKKNDFVVTNSKLRYCPRLVPPDAFLIE